MNNVLETNVLIIGKSGVGKSSLLNYIFDQDLMETGTGRPVTKKGIFTKQLKINDNFTVNLSDTWGLEANKAKEWEELINNEIKEHDCEEISAWFHTILYCLSAKSSRVEDFEKKIIKNLINDGNKVIVVLTHSDTNNIEDAIKEMSSELKGIGVEMDSIIKVSSVGKKLLGGRTTKTFGKEEVLYSIQNNLWITICNKLPKAMDKIIDESLNNWYSKCSKYVNEELKWHNSNSNKKLEEISFKVKSLLDIEIDDLKYKLNEKYNEVYNYFFKLSQVYNMISAEKVEYEELEYGFNFKVNMIKRIVENVISLPIILSPLSMYFDSMTIRDKRKEDILTELENTKNELERQLKSKNKDQIEEIKKYVVSK